MYLTPRDDHICVYRNKNPLSGCKISGLFYFVNDIDVLHLKWTFQMTFDVKIIKMEQNNMSN